MKTLRGLAAALLCCTMIISCDQETLTNSEQLSAEGVSANVNAKTNQMTLKVSERGYLIFQDEAQVGAFVDYITDRGLDEILDLFGQYNFQPLNSTDFDKNLNPEKFIFNAAGLLQIGNNVFKISDDGFYLLSAKKDYMMNDGIYKMMAEGNFQPQLMNKFSLFKDRGNANFNIIDIAEGNPAGIAENDPPMVTMGKFWGKEEYRMPCNGMGKRWVNVVRRAFWIKVWETGYFEDC